jgi:hypothetical protein
LQWLTRAVLSRDPIPSEWPVLTAALDKAAAHYHSTPTDAAAFLNVGQSSLPASDKVSETAAYTVVTTLLMNLDEAITHE